MKPDSVFAMIYDPVLRACHDHDRHTQFPIVWSGARGARGPSAAVVGRAPAMVLFVPEMAARRPPPMAAYREVRSARHPNFGSHARR
jgi:hypothetical protein